LPKLTLRFAIHFAFGWGAALDAAGLDPAGGAKSPWRRATKSAILEEIRRRKRKGKTLHFKSIEKERWGKPLLRRAKALFGSWDLAVAAATKQPVT